MSWLGNAVARQAPTTTTGAPTVIASNHHTSPEPEWGSIVGAEFSARLISGSACASASPVAATPQGRPDGHGTSRPSRIRTLILARTGEGRKRAMATGQKAEAN
jgi:hypothetical protein